jgi:HK97 family phage major capsid protein
MPTPLQVQRLIEAEDQLFQTRLQYASDSDAAREQRLARRNLRGQMEATVRPSSLPPTIASLSEHERKRYSLINAISTLEKKALQQGGSSGEPLSLESEISMSLARDIGSVPNNGGMFIPTRLRASGLDSKTNSSDAYSVTYVAEDIQTYLRQKSTVMRLGAITLSGLKSNVAIPVQSGASSATWVSENGGSDLGESDSSFAQLTLTPKTLQATTSFSRQLLAQSSADAEAFVRADLASAHASAIDQAAISGSGSQNQPLGLLNNSSVPIAALGQNGAAPTSASLIAQEQSVADFSADLGQLSWLTSPTMRSKLRVLPLFTGATIPCWDCDEGVDELLGRPAEVSRSVPQNLTKGTSNDCHAIILGYWPALCVGEWGVIEVLVDPYAQKRRGQLELTSYSMCDVICRRPVAFCLCLDARNV